MSNYVRYLIMHPFYCLAWARLTDACYSTSVNGPSYDYQLRPMSARPAPWRRAKLSTSFLL